jgi:predicted NAD/FAD-binding protein
MWNHHLLTTISERPPWLTVKGGAQRYIDAVIAECKNVHVHLGTPVQSINRRENCVGLNLEQDGQTKIEIFDEVVLACHGDQARELTAAFATTEDSEILGAFETTPNTAYLHSDLSLMPRRRSAWSAWNYLTTSKSGALRSPKSQPSGALQTVSLTYNMNILQDIPVSDFSDVLVTLNPEVPPSPSTTQAIYEYRHPLYNARMIAAQEKLEHIQGKRGVWYAGAWTGYGFHEDGFSSGMNIGLKLGGSVPWTVQDAKFSRGLSPTLNWNNYVARLIILVLHFIIQYVERLLDSLQGKQAQLTSGNTETKKTL